MIKWVLLDQYYPQGTCFGKIKPIDTTYNSLIILINFQIIITILSVIDIFI